MRKIDPAAIPDNISLFRINVLEAILCQKTVLSNIDYTSNSYLRRLFRLRKRRKELDSLCSQIGKAESISILAIYVVQSRTIKNDPFALIEHSLSPALSAIVDILYGTLFDPDYWIGMGLPPFSKMVFKEHFYKAHSWWVCPYCDMAKDLENASFEVDHLLPKSRFPLLGINEWNLIPICPACNSMHTGKGDNTISQYRNLFAHKIGDLIRFSFNGACQANSSDSDVTNHIELLKLNQRLEKPGIHGEIESIKKKVFRDLKANINNQGLLDYHDSFYFISRDIYLDSENELRGL